MQVTKLLNRPLRDHVRSPLAVSGLLLILWMTGCGGSKPTSTTTATKATPQTYFGPIVYPTGQGIQTYTFDETVTPANFSETFFPTTLPQILNAGTSTVLQTGLRSLNIETTYVSNGGTPAIYSGEPYTTPGGSFAVELAGQAGGLVQVRGQPVVPVVAATSCPNSSSAQTYRFITIPGPLMPAGADFVTYDYGWDPTTETAYGSADISSTGSTINFKNIQQFTLTGQQLPALSPLPTGECAKTYFGDTIAVPGQAVLTDPGSSSGSGATLQATIGIGPSGLLVEDAGAINRIRPGSTLSLPFSDVLGSGTGAVGLPKPSAALDTVTVVGKQYLGFAYESGRYILSRDTPVWSSHLVSFGSSLTPQACPSFANPINPIYGGDFPQANGVDDPSGSPKCDFAIDLGAEDSANNGLYPNAKVLVGSGYATNTTGSADQFSAVAIAGQLNGKYAIFVIGVDSTQPWAIYLLESN